ncbi:hypothetical protein AAC387_Pa01g1753 [Persea americana]
MKELFLSRLPASEQAAISRRVLQYTLQRHVLVSHLQRSQSLRFHLVYVQFQSSFESQDYRGRKKNRSPLHSDLDQIDAPQWITLYPVNALKSVTIFIQRWCFSQWT